MSKEDRINSDEEVPEGMEKRTRRVRRKRRSKGSGGSSGKLFTKGKELLVGMQEEEDDYGHVDVAEQVRRLKRDKDEDKPLDDTWGTKKRSSSWLWIILLGIILPLVGIGLIVSKLTKQEEPEAVEIVIEGGGLGPQQEFSATEGVYGWYLGNSEEVIEEVLMILKTLDQAKTPEEIMSYVRDSPYRKQNPVDLEKVTRPLNVDIFSDINLTMAVSKPAMGTEERGVLITKCKSSGSTPMVIYFVEETVDGKRKVLIDWDATSSWSEMSIKELVEKKPRNEVLIRCAIEKKASYNMDFGQVPHSGYVLSDPKTGDFVFSFVSLDSEVKKVLNNRLKSTLDYGNVFLPLLKDRLVTLRVRYGGEHGGKNIFEIMSFEHETWVRP